MAADHKAGDPPFPRVRRTGGRATAGASPRLLRRRARHLLPDEQMATAARWTGRALRLAGTSTAVTCWRPSCACTAMSFAGRHCSGHDPAAAVSAVERSPRRPWRRAGSARRAAAESGGCGPVRYGRWAVRQAPNIDEGHQDFFNAFTVGEVSIRGPRATGRTGQAVDLADVLRPAKVRRLRSGESSSRSLSRICSPGRETTAPRSACRRPPAATQKRCTCRIRRSGLSA